MTDPEEDTPAPRLGRDLGAPVVGVRYLTAGAFGSELGVSPRAVMAMAQSHQIDYCRFGKWRILIPASELARPELAERRERARAHQHAAA